MPLRNPAEHKDWVQPHTLQWYAQLGNQTGEYSYPWQSTLSEPYGESVFTEEVARIVKGQRVLDVGCGHGEFTKQWSPSVQEIIGFDVTAAFIKKEDHPPNVLFVQGNSKEGLPFQDSYFDCAYNRKGPTSAYPDLRRVVKSGGNIIGLHPGDDLGKELPELYPDLFDLKTEKTPILTNLHHRLDSYSKYEIETITSVEYLHSPIDVIRMRAFGQKQSVYEYLLESLQEVTVIFDRHAGLQGLPITHSRYLVKAKA